MPQTPASERRIHSTKPDALRSDREAFAWLFFEPSLLHKYSYSQRLSPREAALRTLRIYLS